MTATSSCTCTTAATIEVPSPTRPNRAEDAARKEGSPGGVQAGPGEPDTMVLLGWDVVDRATDTMEDFVALTDELVDLPGYVEQVERGYETSRWNLERVYRITHP